MTRLAAVALAAALLVPIAPAPAAAAPQQVTAASVTPRQAAKILWQRMERPERRWTCRVHERRWYRRDFIGGAREAGASRVVARRLWVAWDRLLDRRCG